MNREDGFPIGDLDVGLFHDPKVIALSRQIRDEAQSATYVAFYVALILQSWAAGDRGHLGRGSAGMVARYRRRVPRPPSSRSA